MATQVKKFLSEFLENFNRNHVLLISSEKKLDVKYFFSKRKNLFSFISSLQRKRVALVFKENINIAEWLVHLDGIVSAIIIIPFETDDEEKNKLIKKANTEVVLYDEYFKTNINSYDVDNINYGNNIENISYSSSDWLLTTSGTTGTPKLVIHDVISLTSSTKFKDHDNVWGLMYRLEKFAGIQVFLQAFLSRSTLVVPQSCASLSQSVILFSESNVSNLSATPSLWRKLLMQQDFEISSLKNITLGGETANQNILNALKKKISKR